MFGTCSQRGMDRLPQRRQHGGYRAQRRYSRACSLELEALEARNLLSFNPPANFDVGSTPHNVALADLRRDGVLDLET